MKREKLLVIFTTLALLLGFTLNSYAQGKGQTKKGQTIEKQDQTRDRDRDKTQDRDKTRDQDRDQDRDRDRLHATDQQRDQLHTNLQTADRVNEQIRNMVQACNNTNFNLQQAQQQREQLREQVQNMEQERERFMLGLNEDQKNRFQGHFRNIEKHQEQVNNRLQLMTQEMNQQQFDRIRYRAQVREIEKSIKKWREQYRELEKHMVGN